MTTNSPQQRYARQIQYSPIGNDGQQRIAASRVAVLGCGALGSVAAEILTRAGVGQLRLIDRDVVEWTNLQRQSLYVERDAHEGRSKAAAACEALRRINGSLDIEPIVADVTADNISGILDSVDLVMDAADNFALRFLLNDWALRTETPWVHGGCIGAAGQVRLFAGQGKPCFRCVVPEPPPAAAVDTCDTAGVLGSATHVVASLQATEALKWLSGNRDAVRQTLLSLDLWTNRFRELKLTAALSDDCPACGRGQLDFLEGDRAVVADSAAVLCGRDAVQLNHATGTAVDLKTIATRWAGLGKVQSTPFFVRLFLTADHSVTLFRDGRVVVTGTDQIAQARTICDRYIGG